MGNKEICLWFLTCVETVMGDKVDSLLRAYDVLCGFATVYGVCDSQRAHPSMNVNEDDDNNKM